MGSASELEYHVLLARDLRYLSVESFNHLAECVVEVKPMLASFLKRVRGSEVAAQIWRLKADS